MTIPFFDRTEPLAFNADNTDDNTFHHYDPDKMVNGKRLEDHLRFAVCYWHSFVWPGTNPFGGETFQRDWFPANTMVLAKRRADVAFEMFRSRIVMQGGAITQTCWQENSASTRLQIRPKLLIQSLYRAVKNTRKHR